MDADAAAPPPLPAPEALAQEPAGTRHQVLQGLRAELYGIASVVADGTVTRAVESRGSYPPYGLAQSRYSELRMVVADPEPFGSGSIATFAQLGTALVDTMVWHLDRELADVRTSERRELAHRLDRMLTLFRLDAGPASRPRLRDPFSFLYGGLHFGTSVCVEMVEVMSRLLRAEPAVTPEGRPEVLARSVRPALRLAGINLDDVVPAYQRLHAPPAGAAASPALPSPEASGSWMAAGHFVLEAVGPGAWRIDLAGGEVLGRGPSRRPPTYATLGCPARHSPAGDAGLSAIARLWCWCVELARAGDLLGGPGLADRPG